MIKKIILYLALISIFVIPFGCGGGGESSEDAPAEATMTINPEEIKVTDGSLKVTKHTEYYHITVKDARGNPLKNVELRINFIWAVPDVYGVVQFYKGNNPVNTPLNVLTDEDGTYILKFTFESGGGYEYSGTLDVTSGSLFESADFEVAIPD
jgi:hypothetical protein